MDISETREFRRPRWFVTFYLAAAVVIVLVGLLMLLVLENRAGIPVCAVAVFSFGLYVWSSRTPYVTATADGLTALTSPLHTIRIAWEDVQEIGVKGRFMGGILTLVLKTGRQVQVPLGYLDRKARQDFVQHVRGFVAARAEANTGERGTDGL